MPLSFENTLRICHWLGWKRLIPVYVTRIHCTRGLLLALLVSAGFFSMAQSIYPSTMNITGQFGTMKDFQFEISIGESTSVNTMSNSAIVVTNGVLQTSVAYQPPANAASIFFDEINIYPNPVRDVVQVNFVGKTVGLHQYELFDTQGKKMVSKQFYYFGVPRTEKMDMKKLLPGTYILSVQQYGAVTNQIIKRGSFKIIKVN